MSPVGGPWARRSASRCRTRTGDRFLMSEVKRKDFIAVTDLSESDVTSSGFLSRFLGLCAESAGCMRFLCDAARVPF
jgi:hypothetical protein